MNRILAFRCGTSRLITHLLTIAIAETADAVIDIPTFPRQVNFTSSYVFAFNIPVYFCWHGNCKWYIYFMHMEWVAYRKKLVFFSFYHFNLILKTYRKFRLCCDPRLDWQLTKGEITLGRRQNFPSLMANNNVCIGNVAEITFATVVSDHMHGSLEHVLVRAFLPA